MNQVINTFYVVSFLGALVLGVSSMAELSKALTPSLASSSSGIVVVFK